MADIEQTVQEEAVVETVENAAPSAPPKKSKFITKDVIKCVVVLVVLALVAGVLLGVMNWLTYVDPDETIMKQVADYYEVSLDKITKDEARVVNDGGKSYVSACYVAKGGEVVNVDGITGYCYYSVGSGAKDGTISLLVYIGADGVIKDIEVYEQGETAGYFKKVETANKSKYVGLDLDDIDGITLIGKSDKATDESQINAVSGASYTSTGYHNAIAAAVYAYKNYQEV